MCVWPERFARTDAARERKTAAFSVNWVAQRVAYRTRHREHRGTVRGPMLKAEALVEPTAGYSPRSNKPLFGSSYHRVWFMGWHHFGLSFHGANEACEYGSKCTAGVIHDREEGRDKDKAECR